MISYSDAILRLTVRKIMVRGMTAAASIWAIAALGFAAESALYCAAGIATITVLLMLADLTSIEEGYPTRVQNFVVRMGTERSAIFHQCSKGFASSSRRSNTTVNPISV